MSDSGFQILAEHFGEIAGELGLRNTWCPGQPKRVGLRLGESELEWEDGLAGEHPVNELDLPLVRRYLGRLPWAAGRCRDADEVVSYLAEPIQFRRRFFNPCGINTYEFLIWLKRADLRKVFAQPFGGSHEAFSQWLQENCSGEERYPSFVRHRRPGKRVYRLKCFGHRVREFLGDARKRLGQSNPRRHVCIHGFFSAEIGIGEAGRSMVEALDKTVHKVSLVDIVRYNRGGRIDFTYGDRFLGSIPGDADLHVFVMNAPEFANYWSDIGDLPAFREGPVKIGHWAWETENLRPDWVRSIAHLDGFLAPSEFVANAVGRSTEKPVLMIPFCTTTALREAPSLEVFDRAAPEPFVFFFQFDALSLGGRKNPTAVIRCFRERFANREDVALLIKVQNLQLDEGEAETLFGLVGDAQNIFLVFDTLDRRRVFELICRCACLLSFHRAEGFGYSLFEAMRLGVPVMATGWSGNLAFMDDSNSTLLPFELFRLEEQVGPYPAGERWAEVDVEKAGEAMEDMVEDYPAYLEKAARAQRDLLEKFDPAVMGRKLEEGLERFFG